MRNLKKKIFIILFILLSVSSLRSQTIQIEMPDAQNKEYSFVLCYGLEMDTVTTGILDVRGNAIIRLPDRCKGYRGIAFLRIKDQSMQPLIINNEDFKVSTVDNEFKVEGSRENDAFYKKDSALLSDTSLYTIRFFELSAYLQSLKSVLSGQATGLGAKYKVRQYAVSDLDIDALYTSGLWFFVIDGLTQLYADQESFAEAMISILDRVKSEKVYINLAENLVTIMSQYGWEEAFDIVVPSIVKSDRIAHPQGTLYDAFQLAKLQKGTLAPEIYGLNNSEHSGNTLIFFFESDCSNCRSELEKLIEAYPDLKAKNVRVVSISADHDEKLYSNAIKNIPWRDALCDYKGFSGDNFLNFGIFATPTYFMLDSDHKVLKRYNSLKDIQF